MTPRNLSVPRFFVGLVVVALNVISCGGGNNPAAPSSSAVPPNLTGTFSGTGSDSTGPGRVTWQLTQTTNTINGTMTASTPLRSVAFSGTLAGTLSGTTLAFTVAVPAGGVSDSPSCTVSVTGTATASSTTITGTYIGTNSCTGAFTDGQLALTKS